MDEESNLIHADMDAAIQYALKVGRISQLETTILKRKDAVRAVEYAIKIIKGRWPEVEPMILEDFYEAYDYAKHVIKGRWPEYEQRLLFKHHPLFAEAYARNIIKDRWPEAEPDIFSSYDSKSNYFEFLISNKGYTFDQVVEFKNQALGY